MASRPPGSVEGAELSIEGGGKRRARQFSCAPYGRSAGKKRVASATSVLSCGREEGKGRRCWDISRKSGTKRESVGGRGGGIASAIPELLPDHPTSCHRRRRCASSFAGKKDGGSGARRRLRRSVRAATATAVSVRQRSGKGRTQGKER